MTTALPYLSQLYDRDPESGAYIIDVAADHFEELFNEWDSAPLKRRAIAADLRAYLADCSTEIPSNRPIMLRVTIPADRTDPAREKMAMEGLRNSFRYEVSAVRTETRRTYRLLARYLVAALTLLFVSVGVGYWLPASLPLDMLAAGATIGAWVFMWEALGGLLVCHRESGPLQRRYRRFADAPIICRRLPSNRGLSAGA